MTTCGLAVAARRLVRHIGEQCVRTGARTGAQTGIGTSVRARSRMAIRSRKVQTEVAAATFWRAAPFTPARRCYILTCTGWQGVRYESNMPGKRTRAVCVSAWRAGGRRDRGSS